MTVTGTSIETVDSAGDVAEIGDEVLVTLTYADATQPVSYYCKVNLATFTSEDGDRRRLSGENASGVISFKHTVKWSEASRDAGEVPVVCEITDSDGGVVDVLSFDDGNTVSIDTDLFVSAEVQDVQSTWDQGLNIGASFSILAKFNHHIPSSASGSAFISFKSSPHMSGNTIFEASPDHINSGGQTILRFVVKEGMPEVPQDASLMVVFSFATIFASVGGIAEVNYNSSITPITPIAASRPSVVGYDVSTSTSTGLLKVDDSVTIGLEMDSSVTFTDGCIVNDIAVEPKVSENDPNMYFVEYLITDGDASLSSESNLTLSCADVISETNNRMDLVEDLFLGAAIDAISPKIASIDISVTGPHGHKLNDFPPHCGIGSTIILQLNLKAEEIGMDGSCWLFHHKQIEAAIKHADDDTYSVSFYVNQTHCQAGGSCQEVPLHCNFTDLAGNAGSYATSFKHNKIVVDTDPPPLLFAFFLNTSGSKSKSGSGTGRSYTIDDELLVGLVFATAQGTVPTHEGFTGIVEQGITGSCLLTVDDVDGSELVVLEQQIENEKLNTRASMYELEPFEYPVEVEYFLPYVIEEGIQTVGKGSLFLLSCSYKDSYMNSGKWTHIIQQNLTIDATRPTLTVGKVFSSQTPAIIGSVVTVVLQAGDEDAELRSPKGCTVNNVTGMPIVSGGGGFYQVVYTVQDGDPDSNRTLSFECDFVDVHGNKNSIQAIFETEFLIDGSMPTFSASFVYASESPAQTNTIIEVVLKPLHNSDRRSLRTSFKDGDDAAAADLDARREADRELSDQSDATLLIVAEEGCLLDNRDVSDSFTRYDGDMYMITLRVESGESWEKGNLDFDCTLQDASGNKFRQTTLKQRHRLRHHRV